MSLLWIHKQLFSQEMRITKKVRTTLRERVTLRFTRKGAITTVSVNVENRNMKPGG